MACGVKDARVARAAHCRALDNGRYGGARWATDGHATDVGDDCLTGRDKYRRWSYGGSSAAVNEGSQHAAANHGYVQVALTGVMDGQDDLDRRVGCASQQ